MAERPLVSGGEAAAEAPVLLRLTPSVLNLPSRSLLDRSLGWGVESSALDGSSSSSDGRDEDISDASVDPWKALEALEESGALGGANEIEIVSRWEEVELELEKWLSSPDSLPCTAVVPAVVPTPVPVSIPKKAIPESTP